MGVVYNDMAYDASDITILEPHVSVRKRPAMYVGNIDDGEGMHQLLWEILGNAVDEHLRGGASLVSVRIDGHTVTVEDDGRGIPVDPMPRYSGMSVVEVVFTILSMRGSLFSESPHVHLTSNLWGAGAPVVAYLSSRIDVDVWREGRYYHLAYEGGKPLDGLRDLGPTERTGTRVTFTPDFTVLPELPWRRDVIARRLREIAAFNPELTIRFHHDAHRSPNGVADLVEYEARDDRALLATPLRFVRDDPYLSVDVAMQWTDSSDQRVQGFVSQAQADRGTHIDGFWDGVSRALRRVAPQQLAGVRRPALRELIGRGLVAAVHVGMYHPVFGDPTKDRLESPEARRAVREVMTGALADQLERNDALRGELLARLPTAVL